MGISYRNLLHKGQIHVCPVCFNVSISECQRQPNGRSNDEARPFTSLNLICLNTAFYQGKHQGASVLLLLLVLFNPSILSNKKAEEIKNY